MLKRSRTILRELSNRNGNPQFTHNLNVNSHLAKWTNRHQEMVLKIREWVEGFGSGIFSDNVFEVIRNLDHNFCQWKYHILIKLLVP